MVERETVVVEEKSQSSNPWPVILGVLLLVLVLFLVFGGMNWLNGTDNDTENINIDTPDTIQVQPGNDAQIDPSTGTGTDTGTEAGTDMNTGTDQ